MPVMPKVTINTRDGLALSAVGVNQFAIIGSCSGGTTGDIVATTDPQEIIAKCVRGPAAELACSILSEGGPSVVVCKAATSTAGSCSAVTATRVGSSVGTVTIPTGTAYDSYDVIIKITKSTSNIANGDGEFVIAMDGETFSPPIAIPTNGTYAIPNSGITISFAAAATDSFDTGDVFKFTATAPGMSTSDYTSAFATLKASAYDFTDLFIAGKAADAAGSAAMAAVLKTSVDELALLKRWTSGYMGAQFGTSETDSTMATAFSAFSADQGQVAVVDSDVEWESMLEKGRFYRRSGLHSLATELARRPLNESVGCTERGPVKHVMNIYRNEAKTPALNSARFVTFCTIPGLNGPYITNANTMAPLGSGFDQIQTVRILNLGRRAFSAALNRYLNKSIPTDPATGFIDPVAKLQYENDISGRVGGVLLTPGYATALKVQIRANNNIQTERKMYVKCQIVIGGLVQEVEGEIGVTDKIS